MQSGFNFSLDHSKGKSILVPAGVSDSKGRPGNPFFYFNYSIGKRKVDELKFEVLTRSGTMLYSVFLEPGCTQTGHHQIHWDGFDHDEIFDSSLLKQQQLQARLTSFRDSESTTLLLNFQCRSVQVDWIDIIIDRKAKRIDATLKTNFNDGGATKGEKRTRTYQELLQLAREGLEYHWSREHVSLFPDDSYSFHLKSHNESRHGIRSPKIVYQTNASVRRSRNWELSRILFYNTGPLKYGSKWFYKEEKSADADFKQIAAHEIGHEILLAFGGHIYSKSHKGSSTILTQKPMGNYTYPPAGEIDLMIYYKANAQCPYPGDYNKRSVASETDVLSLIWLSQLKTYVLL